MSEDPESRRDQLLDSGERHFYDGEYEQALEDFDQALGMDEDDPEAQYLRGRALYYLSRDDEAEAAYDRALDLAPDFAPALVHKAELYVRAHGWADEALDLLAEAEELELSRDDRIEAAFVRGIALLEKGEYRRAIEPLNKAVRGDGEWAEAMRERGICRFYLWRFEDAARDLEKTLERDGRDAEACFFLAMALEHLGRREQADAAYDRAAAIDPQTFHRPYRVAAEEFDRLAERAVAGLPEEFRIRFDNLALSVKDLPDRDEGVPPDVQGLFVSVPVTDASMHPTLMPCKILLFKKGIERIARDPGTLQEEIGKTVLHEVGHFFGLDEDDMVRLNIH